MAKLHETTGPWQAVLFTGDLVQKGASEEFRGMQAEVLDRLWVELAKLGSGDAKLLAVPGNHDLFRPSPTKAEVKLLALPGGFATTEDEFWREELNDCRVVVREAFGAYSQWWETATHRAPGIRDGLLPGDFACTLEHDGRRIGIVGLNTAFLQLQGGDYQGRLVWDARQLHQVCGAADDWLNAHDLSLLLTHHGPDWLTPEAQKHGDSEIAPAGHFAAHLFGHYHETGIEYLSVGGSAQVQRRIQGCSLFSMEKFGESPTLQRSHGYAVGQIEFFHDHATLRLWPRIATDQPQGSGWHFIADATRALLPDGFATAPATIPLQHRSTAPRTKPVSSASPAPANSPHPTLPRKRPFFGRDAELKKIAAYLAPDHQGWGVVIDGPGGMGKTALALEAAHRAPGEHFPLKLFITAKGRELHPDGIHRKHEHRVENYHALLVEIARALGRTDIETVPQEQRPDQVRHALTAQRALLILDNLESFTPAERRRIYDLLEILPDGCRAIVTTRRRDETAARTVRLDKLEFPAAQQLLTELGKTMPEVAKLAEAEIHTLYEETSGNPLLLTWVAAQLGRVTGRCRTVEEAVARLHQAPQRHGDDDNDALDFVFGDLLDTFTESETAVLAALAYFPEPAPLDWLLPLTGLTQRAAEGALDDLRNRALLIEDADAETWLLPPLAARFLRSRRPEAINTAGERLAKEAYALAVQHGYSNNAPFTELEATWSRIEPALPLLLAGENDRLQTVCSALDQFLNFTGRWDVLLALSRDAEAKAVAAGDNHSAGSRAYQSGMIHYRQGEADAVLENAVRCATYWANSGARLRAIAIQLRGLGHQLREDYPAALAAYGEVLDLDRSLNPESQDVSIDLDTLASVKQNSGDLSGAEADYREALRIAAKIGYREGVATYTGNLAELFLKREDWRAAESLAGEALELARGVGRQELIASNHHRLAVAQLRQQRPAEALPHAREAVEIFTPLRHRDLPEAQATLAECEAACRAAAVPGATV